MTDIMLDLEVLGGGDKGCLVSIGAVKFDLVSGELGEEFYREVSNHGIDEQEAMGRHPFKADNFRWWLGQSDEVRRVFTGSNLRRHSIYTILHEFGEYCTRKDCVWGNGVDFDNVFLKGIYEDLGVLCPFISRNNRCYRTYKAMHGNRAKRVRIGEHHVALDDAKTQAVHLMAMYKAVTKEPKR